MMREENTIPFASTSQGQDRAAAKIAVVIPSFRVRNHILGVLANIGPAVSSIYVVDDKCPEKSGDLVAENSPDPRVHVIYNRSNLGVGGAVMAGYQRAIQDGADVIVKIDGDGQMDPRLITDFVMPVISGDADYTKGNRFYDLDNIRRMPALRIFGNAVLSFMAKLSTGYWNLFDPTNGYTAIDSKVARKLNFSKLSERYFFETDVLFRLNTLRAKVVDIPMDPVYEDEVSNLSVPKVLPEFIGKHSRNFLKRIFYNYFLRDFSIASIELSLGLLLLLFGLTYGTTNWIVSSVSGEAAPFGTVMVAALPVLIGLQLIIAFLGYDIATVPARALHPKLNVRDAKSEGSA